MNFTKQKIHAFIIIGLVAISAIVIDVFQRFTIEELSWLNRPSEASNMPVEEFSIKEWVFTRLEQNLDTDAAIEGMMIITCESGWNPDAFNVNTNGSVDLGLWQINSIHKDISNTQKLDYMIATDWAINKYWNSGNSWHAWTCANKLGL